MGNSVSEPQPQSSVADVRPKQKESCPRALGLSTGVDRLPGCRRPPGPHLVLPGEVRSPHRHPQDPPTSKWPRVCSPFSSHFMFGSQIRPFLSLSTETVRCPVLDPTRRVADEDTLTCDAVCGRHGAHRPAETTPAAPGCRRQSPGRGPGSSSGAPGATASSDV